VDLPRAAGLTYDPRTVIEAVNLLAAGGTERALAELRGAVEAGAPADGPLLVARVAFVPAEPGTPLPRLELGRPDVDEEVATRHFPLFPIALDRDIPFLLVTGYQLGGETDAGAYLDWCERHGRLREPLRPADDPPAAAEALLGSEAWAALALPASHAEMIREQARRLAAG
jgi:hypothetical protein